MRPSRRGKMKNKIDVSLIFPAYNATKTIGSPVNKILSETRMAIELIIVDIQSGLKNECKMEKCLSAGMDIRKNSVQISLCIIVAV